MVYADVPEHEGFEKGEVPEPRPTTTDGWLARISDQLQVFVDAINDAREDDEDVDTGDTGADVTGADASADADAKPDADDKPDPKKTAAAKKTAEVKGD